MKTAFLAVMLVGLIVLGTHDVQAQVYGYPPSWNGAQYQGYAQEYDPYYQLHVAALPAIPTLPDIPNLLFCRRCWRPMVVNADHSGATSDYQSAATRDEKKIKRL